MSHLLLDISKPIQGPAFAGLSIGGGYDL